MQYSAKDHYTNHLGNFYSWMVGDLLTKQNEFLEFLNRADLIPLKLGRALDLGAGHGVQSVPLAKVGYQVKAIDFNLQLLVELQKNSNGFSVETIEGDMQNLSQFKAWNPELVVCCGDTLTHLDSLAEVEKFLQNISFALSKRGKLVLSFRDYSSAKTGEIVSIPVKKDDHRILTCVLEYEQFRVKVTDKLQERHLENWIEKQSSYFKVRIAPSWLKNILRELNFQVVYEEEIAGMLHLVFSCNA